MSKNDRQASLDMALKQIEKSYGKGSIMMLGANTQMGIETSSSGSLLINKALGGGYPKGRIIEIYGPESSGKTTVALHAIAEAQKAGLQAAFIDAEHALDPAYAQKLGVNINELLIAQPDHGEQALEIAETLVSSSAVGIIVIDSVAALVPKAEIEGDMGDSHMGLQARLMSQALRKLSGIINKTNTICIFINQVREKIGVMFGNPETTTGGRALKFYASQRIEVRRGTAIKKGTEAVAHETKIKVVKNKIAPPFRDCTIQIAFGVGIDIYHEIIELGQTYKNENGKNIITKSGSWFSYTNPQGEDERLGQGAENLKDIMRDRPELFDFLKTEINKAQQLEAKKLQANFVPEDEGEFDENALDEE